MLSIAQAAKLLSVSTKTLRRWEKQGSLIPQRSVGNQRRYSEDQINTFTKPSRLSLSPLTLPYNPDGQNLDLTLLLSPQNGRSAALRLLPNQKKVLVGTVASLVIAISAVIVAHSQFPQALKIAGDLIRQQSASIAVADNNILRGVVLASETGSDQYLFTVGVESLFKNAVTIEGNLTAPNILYGVVAGTNVSITGNKQRPTISVTDQTTGLNIFKTITVGSDSFSAAGKTDTLTFAAGDNVTISTDTTNKKLTIKAATTDVTSSGWTDDGTMVRLTTAGDIVSIGSATGSAKLAISGNDNRDLFTASQSGNLVLKLTNAGDMTLAGDLAVNGGDLTTSATTFNLISANATTVNIANAANTVNVAGGSSSTGCTVDGTTGNLTCTGSITGSSSGSSGFWTRTSTTLSPTTANDVVTVNQAATGITTANLKNIAYTGTGTFNTTSSTLTNYGGYFTNTSTRSAGSNALTNVGLYANASGAQNNYAAIFENGNVGIGTTAPGSTLDVAGATGITNESGGAGYSEWVQITNAGDYVSFSTTNDTVIRANSEDLILAAVNATGAIRFGTGTGSTEKMTIASSGDVTMTGDLAVNGADITTTGTTATLFNTTATTLSLGGAATTALNLGNGSGNYTAINLGSGSGTHTINIAGTGATSADTINIGTGGTTADTITIGNSASTTALNLTSGTGAQTFTSSVATGTTSTSAFVFTDNALTSGTGLYLSSTATGLTSGGLAVFDWSPGSATTATGNLFKINIGTNGTTTGNLFTVQDTGSDLFSVSEVAITSTLPHAFNAAGDVSIAYDLQFTNQTASFIKSNAPLYIQAGESFENNDLTLQTFGTGAVSVLPAVATTGSPTAFRVTGAAHTTLTASIEAPDVNINLNRTVQFSTGALTTQRAFLIQAPTYSFSGASTLTDAATLGISGAPVKSTNATITNTHGILIQAGAVSTATNAYGLSVNAPTGATNVYAAQFIGGNVGIGTASPLNVLDVSGSAATASAMIRNTSTSAGIAGLAIKLSSTTLDTTSRFINFLDLNSTIIGKINAANTTTVAYSTNGTDFGEYFVKDSSSFTPGDIVSTSANDITLTPTSYDPRMIGIVSNSAGFVGGKEGDNKVLVGLSGQVPVRIAATSAAISKGDFITSSTIAGKGMKATKPGFVIGKALEDWTPSHPAETIQVYINNIWADPNQQLAFDEAGNMTIAGTVTTVAPNSNQVSQNTTDLLNLQGSLQNLEGKVATLSAQLANLQVQNDPAATMAAHLWQLATDSGKLATVYAVQVPELTITGALHVGLLTIDDLTASLSSPLGEITITGNLAVTGKIQIRGDSTGKAVIPAGSTTLTIGSTAATATSQIFATPEKVPIVVATESTESGKLVIRIPEAITSDLKVNWWVIN